MKFDYTPIYSEYGIYPMPFVDVVFSNPTDPAKKAEILSLVDSGAGAILLNAEFAEPLGIDLEAGEHMPFYGITSAPEIAYQHTLKIRPKHDLTEFSVPCYFLRGLQTSALLGQQGFFDHYNVAFKGYKEMFELAPYDPKKKK